MGEKVEDLSIEQLQDINDELNERNQKLVESRKKLQAEYQTLSITNYKGDRLIGKMMNKLGLYESKLLRYEIEVEDLRAELNGYREKEAERNVPADDDAE